MNSFWLGYLFGLVVCIGVFVFMCLNREAMILPAKMFEVVYLIENKEIVPYHFCGVCFRKNGEQLYLIVPFDCERGSEKNGSFVVKDFYSTYRAACKALNSMRKEGKNDE